MTAPNFAGSLVCKALDVAEEALGMALYSSPKP